MKINSLFSLHPVSVCLSLLLYWRATEVICESTRKREVLFSAGRRHGHFLCGSTLKKERINEGVEHYLFTDMQNKTEQEGSGW